MNNFFRTIFDNFKRRKFYFVFLLILSFVAIALGVIAAINFDSNLTIDLSHIAYIRFLKGGGFGSLMFGLFLSICVFFFAIIICHWKKFLLPLAIIFYLYLVYSQVVVLVSIVLIYGVFNCAILFVLLLVYFLLLWMIFLFIMCELISILHFPNFFRICFSFRENKTLFWFICLIVLTLIFCIVLTILKKFVILLVFG